jgi:hypothetical protein
VTLRRPGLGRLLGRTTLLPSVVETVVPESKLFIVGATGSDARVPARRRERLRDVLARIRAALATAGAALARAGAALARAAAALRPAASWSRQHGAAALRFAAQGTRRGAQAGARASATAAARTRREAPRLAAWLAARSRSSRLATARSLRSLGAASRVAAARAAAGSRVASSHLGAWARTAARALGDLTVLVAVFVSDTWRKAATAQTTAPEDDTEETVRPELEPQSDLDAPLARDETARRPQAAARPRKRT